MNLDRALQLTTAGLAIMGALFLGLGQQTILPLVLGFGAIASVLLTDVFRWLRLNRIVANVVALGAVAWSLRDFLKMGSEGQLLAIADMLVYLQIVLLFQEKSGRVYWQLMVLSLLQVVVAAALNLGPQFGLLLALYMVLALLTLVLLCLHRQVNPALLTKPKPAPAKTPRWQKLLAAPEIVQPALTGTLALAARPAFIVRQVGLLSLATLFFAAIFFGATPRLGERDWAGSRSKITTATGFAPEATLEEFGRIHQSNQLVMRATFTRLHDQRAYTMIGEPYFHGTVNTEYLPEPNGSRWAPARRRTSRYWQQSEVPAEPPPANQLIRQDMTLETASPPSVFAVLPLYYLPDTPRELRYSPTRGRIDRVQRGDESPLQREYRYAFATTSIRNGRQLHGLPHRNPALTGQDEFLLEMERTDLTQFDAERFSRLAARAASALEAEDLIDGSQYLRALALERHFQAPGLYKYSLVFNFERDKSLDPVEDFVANHRTGHCAYFASALVLMLRSQGIPARMIVGYKGGDYNSLGKYYLVRQRHAHAWVEALLPFGEVPDSEIAGSPSRGGTWYRLDPTPASFEAETAGDDTSVVHRAVEAFDYVELLWRDYVLSLNATRQKDSLYDPVSNRTLSAMPAWLDSLTTRGWMRNLNWLISRESADPNEAPRVFDIRLAFVTVLALVAGASLFQLSLVLWRRRRRWSAASRGSGAGKVHEPPAFYRRLESLLARLKLHRESGQTARELAAAAATRLKAGEQPQVAEIPGEIVAAYYKVRFGEAALDNHETAKIEHALAQLVPAVHAKS